jgi:ubiquinone/menaquinone biosynthesis C-methylase UbiE
LTSAVLLVLGADERLVGDALEQAGEGGGVIVLDPSAEQLEAVERARPDPRIWYLIGDAEVVPLPDDSVDGAVGSSSPDVERVVR